ncbi:tetratricopeptide repeat protein [Calothrix sp. NIES-3974]|uniref:tetratricopeptide repeat protein n=1 Tax=Calothrix sp. NIES-3974 TaxID=2005462 RepID=UPI000B61D2B6|nr:tetratricopeptide repeat protein [Calothrix sp. NIES-3974]BAZ05917.1 TPR repeat protein [Calothrix sp. NIES-3974]
MLETLSPKIIFAIASVFVSAVLLIYFAWRTIVTANWYKKGVDFYQAEDYEAAETAFRNCIAMNSTNDAVHLLLGDTLMRQGKVEDAIAQFQEVIRRAPKRADAYLRLSNAYMRQEQRAAAIEQLELARNILRKQRQINEAARVSRLLDKLK